MARAGLGESSEWLSGTVLLVSCVSSRLFRLIPEIQTQAKDSVFVRLCMSVCVFVCVCAFTSRS